MIDQIDHCSINFKNERDRHSIIDLITVESDDLSYLMNPNLNFLADTVLLSKFELMRKLRFQLR